MNLVHNERIKYFATLLNTIAAAAIAAGVIAPLVALTYGVPGPIGGSAAIVISLAWLVTGVVLHIGLQAMLGRLRE
jgi:phytoene dehydrogenase-like protein